MKLERRILSKMYGSGLEGLAAIAGRQTLDEYLAAVGEHHKTTSLVTKLKDGEDPDDYFSCVSYEKGYNFLLWLEHCVKEDYGADFHGKYNYTRALFHLNLCCQISNSKTMMPVSVFLGVKNSCESTFRSSSISPSQAKILSICSKRLSQRLQKK